MSKSSLDAVYDSLKQESRAEVLKNLQPDIEKLQDLCNKIVSQLAGAATSAPAKRGPKKRR